MAKAYFITTKDTYCQNFVVGANVRSPYEMKIMSGTRNNGRGEKFFAPTNETNITRLRQNLYLVLSLRRTTIDTVRKEMADKYEHRII